jgi:hypothetical protein
MRFIYKLLSQHSKFHKKNMYYKFVFVQSIKGVALHRHIHRVTRGRHQYISLLSAKSQ